MQVVAKPLEKDHILGLREQIASAEIEEGRIVWCAGTGNVGLSMEIDLADGGRITETINLEPMLQVWATEAIAGHQAGVTS
jgi:hypothetical protein